MFLYSLGYQRYVIVMWQANVFTNFPDAFPGNLGVSVIGRALKNELWRLNCIDLKQFPAKNDRIDSYPYGGGAGMLLSPITFEKSMNSMTPEEGGCKRIYCSPRGRQMSQKDMEDISKSPGITILCGRYEGVDQRILDVYGFEEISIGDFVLLGGEVAAMVIIEACVRLIPGVVGEEESIKYDSFQENLLEYNQYTKPEVFREMKVPEVLVSGNHQKIEEFRNNMAKMITMKRRPDLWAKYVSETIRK